MNIHCVVLLLWIYAAKPFKCEKVLITNSHDCTYFPGQPIADKREKQICCHLETLRFESNWQRSNFYLSTFLLKLQSWNCSKQFTNQCETRPYAFNDFTSLMYERFCSPEKFETKCYGKVKDMLYADSTEISVDTNLTNTSSLGASKIATLMKGVTSANFTSSQNQDQCVTVSLFDSDVSGGFGSYHEVSWMDIPFCGLIWCGYDLNSVNTEHVSLWSCMSQRCKVAVILEMVFPGLLGLCVIVANAMVLLTFSLSPKLKNSQVVYKKSLAVADIIVGIVVLPTFITTMYNWTHTRHMVADEFISKVPHVHVDNKTRYDSIDSFNHMHSMQYLNAVGFFTALSVMVSVYTLTMAGFDRLWAICVPLNYSRHNSVKVATITVFVLWVIAITFSCLPLFTTDVGYNTVASVIIGMSGPQALVLYSLLLILPLIVSWCTTIAVYVSAKRHATTRAKMVAMTRSTSKQGLKMEKRLACTLSLMLGVFTLCILPSAILMLSSFGLPQIYYNDPENFDPIVTTQYISAEYVCALVLMSNSLWNFLIYSARNRDFRVASRNIFVKAGLSLGFQMTQKTWGGPTVHTSRSAHSCHANPAFQINNSTAPSHDDTNAGYLSSNNNTPKLGRKELPVTSTL